MSFINDALEGKQLDDEGESTGDNSFWKDTTNSEFLNHLTGNSHFLFISFESLPLCFM